MAAASSAANDANGMPKFIPAFPTSHRLLDDALRPVTIPRNLRPYHLRRRPSTTVSSPGMCDALYRRLVLFTRLGHTARDLMRVQYRKDFHMEPNYLVLLESSS